MLNSIFGSITSNGATPLTFLICIAVSLALGLMIAAGYMYKSRYSKSFVITLAILPAIVQVVIMLVNGNIGTGVAVMGAFSLIRFRSIPGSAREIGIIFLAMAVGLATGMGFLAIAALLAIIITAVLMIYSATMFGESKRSEKELKITIPEDLNYNGLFNDIFEKYTSYNKLIKVRTTNMGSLYQLTYCIVINNDDDEKKMIDEIRCRNGNLEIVCGYPSYDREVL